MKQPYGKMPRGTKKATAPPADRLVVDIKDRHTLEQFAFEVSKIIATLHDHGVYGVEACTLYLKTLDEKGERIALWNEKGEPITRLDMNAALAPPPYRDGH